MKKGVGLKAILLVIWIGLFGLVVYLIGNQNILTEKEVVDVATLDQKLGEVMYREEGLVKWTEAVSGQKFEDGSWVATGVGSSAEIKFKSGQVAQLSPDTQVQIRGIMQENKDFSYMITLSRGAIVAKVAKVPQVSGTLSSSSASSLVVRSGNTSFNVENGKSMGLAKVQGQKDAVMVSVKQVESMIAKAPLKLPSSQFIKPQFIPLAARTFTEKMPPLVVLSPEKFPLPSFAPLAEVKIPKIEKKILENVGNLKKLAVTSKKMAASPFIPPEPPAPVVTGLEYQIKADGHVIELYTDWSFSSLNSETLKLSVKSPSTENPTISPIPLLKLQSPSNGKYRVVYGKNSLDLDFSTPFRDFVSLASAGTSESTKILTILAQGGVRVKIGNTKKESFEEKKTSIRIHSYGELPFGPMTIGLDKFERTIVTDTPWIPRKSEIDPKNAPLWLTTFHGATNDSLRPLIRAATQFGLRANSSNLANPVVLGEQIFLVRKQQIIGAVGGAKLNRESLDVVMDVLKADFAYRGMRDDLLEESRRGGEDLAKWADRRLNDGLAFYVMRRNKIYPVSREFMKSNSEVAAFIDEQARAIFVNKVDIIASRK